MAEKQENFLSRLREAALAAGAIEAVVERFDDGSVGLAITRQPVALRSKSSSLDDYIDWVREVA